MAASPRIAVDILAEQELIALVLTRADVLSDLDTMPRPDDFHDPRHRLIWQAILDLDARHAAIDPVSVSAALGGTSAQAKAGGVEYLSTLSDHQVSGQDAQRRSEIVINAARNRALLQAGDRIVESARQGGDARENVNRATYLLDGIVTDATTTGPVQARDLMPSVVDRVEMLSTIGGGIAGLPSGLEALDRQTGGFYGGQSIVLAGRPSMGKTSMAMQIAEHVSLNGQGAVAVFDLEMSAQDLLTRSAASLGGVDVHAAISGTLDKEALGRFVAATNRLAQARLFIDDNTIITPADIRSRARRIKREHGLSLIVVDYLQLMTGAGESRTQEVATISRQMKLLAKELDVPLLLLSQLSRSSEFRDDKRPIMSDLRDSGAIEQDADLIMFVHRDDMYHENSPTPGMAEVIIAKHRNGPIGSAWFRFHGSQCRFSATPPPDPTVLKPVKNRRRSAAFAD